MFLVEFLVELLSQLVIVLVELSSIVFLVTEELILFPAPRSPSHTLVRHEKNSRIHLFLETLSPAPFLSSFFEDPTEVRGQTLKYGPRDEIYPDRAEPRDLPELPLLFDLRVERSTGQEM